MKQDNWIANIHQEATELIEFLHFKSMAIDFFRLPPQSRVKIASDHGSTKKSKKTHPILGIGNRKTANGREEVVVQSQSGCDGHENRHAETPLSGSDKDGKQISQDDGSYREGSVVAKEFSNENNSRQGYCIPAK